MIDVYFYFYLLPNTAMGDGYYALHIAPANEGFAATIALDLGVLNFSYGPLDVLNNVYPTLAAAKAQLITNEMANALHVIDTAYGSTIAQFAGIIDWYEPLQTQFDAKVNASSLATVATSGSYADLTNKPTIPTTTRTTSALSLSLVGTGATGTQISSTKDSTVHTTVSTSATASIAGAAVSSVALKICATNSATEGDWTTIAVSETGQSYTLAIALQGVTTGKGQLVADVPAGWYVKLVNSGSGTHSEGFVAGQKTIYG